MNLIKRRKLMFEGACTALCRTCPRVGSSGWSRPFCDVRCDRLDHLPGVATSCKLATEIHGQAARAVIAAWDTMDANLQPPSQGDKLLSGQAGGGEIEIFTRHFGKKMPLVSVLHALAGQEGNDGDEGNAMQMAAEVIEDLMDAEVARAALKEIEEDPGSLVTLSDLHGQIDTGAEDEGC